MEITNLEPNITLEISGNDISVKGKVIGISDYKILRDAVYELIEEDNKKNITITFYDATSLTSSILGMLLKLVQKDNIEIAVNVKNSELYNLLDLLGLKKLLKVNQL